MSVSSPTATYRASCHCQRNITEFTLPLPSPPHPHGTAFTKNEVCDCSHCIKRRIVWFFLPSNDAMRFLKGGDEQSLKEYRFGTKNYAHKFCGTCGTYMFVIMKGDDHDGQIAINLRAIRDKDFDLWSLPLTRYSAVDRPPPYDPPALPIGAQDYLGTRAKHYDYPTQVYTGGCHCKAVTFGVLCKPLEEVLIIDCGCSICLGNGDLWVYPGRHDVFFHPSSSSPYNPDPKVVTRYIFGLGKNEHVFCNTCGCQIFEAREAEDGSGFEGWEEDNGENRSFGLNVALINGIEVYLKDGLGTGLKGLKKNREPRGREPLYELKL